MAFDNSKVDALDEKLTKLIEHSLEAEQQTNKEIQALNVLTTSLGDEMRESKEQMLKRLTDLDKK